MTITDKQAMNALESLDDYARMDIGVAAHGPHAVLRAFILQHATTVGLDRMTRAELDDSRVTYEPTAPFGVPNNGTAP